MKRGGPAHWKVMALATALQIPKAHAVGTLELLFHAVAQHKPRGDVGAWPNVAIASMCEWGGDADAFVEALESSGWIDQNAEYRYIVHDWASHADDATHMAVARMRQTFACGAIPKLAKLSGSEREAIRTHYVALDSGHDMATAWPRDGHLVTTPSLPSPPLPNPSHPKPPQSPPESSSPPPHHPAVYGTPEPPGFRKAVCDRWDAARAAGVPVGPKGPGCVRLIPATLDEIANCPELDKAARADPPAFLLRQLDAYLSSREAKQAPLNRLGTFLRKPDGRRKWLETPEQWNHQRDAVKPEPEETVHDRIARQIERVANAKQ